jgi:hypothetical protein
MTLGSTGLLIIRAWVEEGSSKPLRAQVRLSFDVAAGFATEMTLADVPAVAKVVEAWLEEIVSNGLPDQ